MNNKNDYFQITISDTKLNRPGWTNWTGGLIKYSLSEDGKNNITSLIVVNSLHFI